MLYGLPISAATFCSLKGERLIRTTFNPLDANCHCSNKIENVIALTITFTALNAPLRRKHVQFHQWHRLQLVRKREQNGGQTIFFHQKTWACVSNKTRATHSQ